MKTNEVKICYCFVYQRAHLKCDRVIHFLLAINLSLTEDRNIRTYHKLTIKSNEKIIMTLSYIWCGNHIIVYLCYANQVIKHFRKNSFIFKIKHLTDYSIPNPMLLNYYIIRLIILHLIQKYAISMYINDKIHMWTVITETCY